MSPIPDSQNIRQLSTKVGGSLYGRPTASETKSVALGKKPMLLDPQDAYMSFSDKGAKNDLSLSGGTFAFTPAAEEGEEMNAESYKKKDRKKNDGAKSGNGEKKGKKEVIFEKVSFGDGHKKLFIDRKTGIAIFDEI
ncbi:MAG: hypothetical protein K8T10_16375 [Candidatus Eremiobacteraeota bacterium]|nr:hypothetical protein [Candidatus Eremiobacteraeota bacterium]